MSTNATKLVKLILIFVFGAVTAHARGLGVTRGSQQFAELVRGQARVLGDVRHGECVDRVVSWDRQAHSALDMIVCLPSRAIRNPIFVKTRTASL